MDLKEMFEFTQKTWIFPKLDRERPDFAKVYVTLCLSGEIGELSNLIKKQFRSQIIPKEDLEKEFADIFYYYLRLAHLCEIDIEKAFINKMKFNLVKYGQVNFTIKDERMNKNENKTRNKRPNKNN